MKLAIIVAVSDDGAIGHEGQLLWHLSEDLKRFRRLTTGHSIIMGRKTFDSLPNGALPNRRNIVVSRMTRVLSGAEVYSNLEDALRAVETDDLVYVIGGGEIYKSLLPLASEMHLTVVHHLYPKADTHFPEWNPEEWDTLTSIEIPADGEKNQFSSTYYHLTRKKK